MTERILARRPLPGDRPAGPIPSGPKAVAKRAKETTSNVSQEVSAADRRVVVVSQATATFLDRHPMWCDGRGVELKAPAHRAVGQADVENIPPPATAEERAARRVKEREGALELWKRVRPDGYMGQPTERSEYQVSLEYDESKLDAAKNCPESNWKHHLRKTDTAAYVEAVAKGESSPRRRPRRRPWQAKLQPSGTSGDAHPPKAKPRPSSEPSNPTPRPRPSDETSRENLVNLSNTIRTSCRRYPFDRRASRSVSAFAFVGGPSRSSAESLRRL